MNPERQQAIDYLRAPSDGLWHWAENGNVIVWRDGATIAFREEIAQVLEWLAPNGLPSFGAIVFLLAACRGKLLSIPDLVVESNVPLPPAMGNDAAVLVTARKQLRLQLEAALSQLAKVATLPGELISGLKAKCILAEAVFEPAKVERYVEARTVLRGMREPMSDSELVDSAHPGEKGRYIRQVHIVAEGLKLHSPESLALRLRTGLDALPKELDANLPTAERARRLIDELSRDREYGSVARAARELMAAVRLPRRLGEREQLAIGGVADITNRGPLDRLLLSELAYDDLTLSVRVALNEALYLRREPPMREPPGTLALLLDSGVRLWGVPRVLAASVALALIARDKQHCTVLAWRANGKKLEPVDLLSRKGLMEHLGALETNAHPGESAPAFADAMPPGVHNQSVLITHRDTLDDPEFRRALAENPSVPGFIAVVDREGRFELHTSPFARRSPLCEADLDLASVFEGEPNVPLIQTQIDPSLPLIFGVTPFPFLLPLAGALDFSIKSPDGFTYAVMNDRRLVQFKDQKSGARVLASNLPAGKTIWMDCVDGTLHVVKAGSSQRATRLLSLSLPYGQLRVVDLVTGPEVLAVHRYDDAIVLIRRHDVRAYSLGDGRQLGHATNPHPFWSHGRFFRGNTHFYFVVWDGERVKFEPVTMDFSPVVVAGIFDRRGGDPGPWIAHRGGVLLSLSSKREIKLSMPPELKFGLDDIRISRDGNRVHYSVSNAKWSRLRDLELGTETDVLKPPRLDFLLNPIPALPTWNLYRVITSITLLSDGIGLCNRKNIWRKLSLDLHGKLRIVPLPEKQVGSMFKLSAGFGPPRQTNHGCTLQTAQFTTRGKVFLDSRGLLHFKSSDSNVPEVSLVLSDGEIAGWTSDGHTCGPAFFFEGARTSKPNLVFNRIMQFFSSL